MANKSALSLIIDILFRRSKSKPKKAQQWGTVYTLSPFFTNMDTGEVHKKWDLELQVCGKKLRVMGLNDDVDIMDHPCYNAFIVPWVNEQDYVILKDGTVYQFKEEIHLTSLSEDDGYRPMDEMNMDELESLADNLINNRQKETTQGIFAQDYGMMLLGQINSSEEFVEQYFKKDKT